MQRIFLAIDIGASSGRHIVGIEADGALQTDEVYRFPNGVQRENGHLIWDIEGIFQHVKAGIKAAFAKYPHIHRHLGGRLRPVEGRRGASPLPRLPRRAHAGGD